MSAATATRLTASSEYGARTTAVTHVVLHHGAVESLAALERLMEPGGRRISAHYAVKDGQRILKVPLSSRGFSLSSPLWDSRSVTVECANESVNGWTISDASHESLAIIVADSARRFGFYPHRDGNPKTWTVIGHREVFTIHGASYATACPGGMDLSRIVRRAQELLAPPTPTPALNDMEIDVKLIKRGEGSPEWSLFHPSLRGLTDLERGYIVTTDESLARGWARTWGTGFGQEKAEPRDVYVEMQAAARASYDAYVRGIPAPAVGGDASLKPVLDAIAKVPTAAQNGQAARDAIVK